MTWRERSPLYDRLRSQIGNTPLTRLSRVGRDRESSIFVKHERLNPTGSHYDRIILEVLRRREERGDIERGDVLLDTTTGNSGASLAWLSRVLGFKCNIIIPEDAPPTRIQQIESYGAKVETSPAGEYTDGLIATISEKLRLEEERDFDFPIDHASDEVGPQAAMEELGRELRDQFAAEFPDEEEATHLVVGLGNGASVHMAGPLREEGCEVVGFEPIKAPMNFLQKYGDEELERIYGPPPEPSLQHGLWGTGAGTSRKFTWPIMGGAWDLLDDIRLVTEEEWSHYGEILADQEAIHVGRSSAAGVAVATRLVAEADDPVNVICIAYDSDWKYLGCK